MSARLISRSPDLKRLRDEGYELAIRESYLLVSHVPYVTPERAVAYGTIVSTLNLAGDATTAPETHTVDFIGGVPCDQHGQQLAKIINDPNRRTIASGLTIDCMFSSKPVGGTYGDYHEKITAYVEMLAGPARAIDPGAAATTFRVVDEDDEDPLFQYYDTNSSRAGIAALTAKLRSQRLAIVGLGGTGSYVLDMVAKTPVDEIHLFDGDPFLQHNAFRAPGAAARDELETKPNKANYFAEQYARIRRRGVVAHDAPIDDSNVELLGEMDFVFLCLDDGPAKKQIVAALDEFGIAFVDAGIGVAEQDGTLAGLVRVTTSTRDKRDHIPKRISFGRPDPDDDYDHNIQIAELNALNAALAVIKWKKLYGFYLDLDREHHSVYEIDGNNLINEDLA
jgi:hypothetical protein